MKCPASEAFRPCACTLMGFLTRRSLNVVGSTKQGQHAIFPSSLSTALNSLSLKCENVELSTIPHEQRPTSVENSSFVPVSSAQTSFLKDPAGRTAAPNSRSMKMIPMRSVPATSVLSVGSKARARTCVLFWINSLF